MRIVPLVALAAAFALSPAKAETSAADGTLLSSRPCPPQPLQSYDDYLKEARAELDREAALARKENIAMPAISDERLRASLAPREKVEEHLAYRGFECRVITYASGGLRIGGLLWKPVDTTGKKLPLLIALRGGNSKFGAMEPWRYWGWHDFLKAGYVVLSSQYRGGPGSDGADTFGSEGDLGDVRALLPLASSLGYVDTGQLYAHGGSRGGMQLYMLARAGLPLKAMAVRAGLADFRRSIAQRPAALGLLEMLPDFKTDPEGAKDRRSASLWAHELKVPTIIFHGTDDWRLSVADALDVGKGLHKSGTPFEMHLYEGDTHAIDLNQEDMIRRTLDFFERHRDRSPR